MYDAKKCNEYIDSLRLLRNTQLLFSVENYKRALDVRESIKQILNDARRDQGEFAQVLWPHLAKCEEAVRVSSTQVTKPEINLMGNRLKFALDRMITAAEEWVQSRPGVPRMSPVQGSGPMPDKSDGGGILGRIFGKSHTDNAQRSPEDSSLTAGDLLKEMARLEAELEMEKRKSAQAAQNFTTAQATRAQPSDTMSATERQQMRQEIEQQVRRQLEAEYRNRLDEQERVFADKDKMRREVEATYTSLLSDKDKIIEGKIKHEKYWQDKCRENADAAMIAKNEKEALETEFAAKLLDAHHKIEETQRTIQRLQVLLSLRDAQLAKLEQESEGLVVWERASLQPGALRERLRDGLHALPPSLRQFTKTLLETVKQLDGEEPQWTDELLARIEQSVYTPAATYGVLAAQGLANTTILHDLLACQQQAHERLTALGVRLLCPSRGDALVVERHTYTDKDVVQTHEDPALERTIHSLKRIGFYHEPAGRVLRKAEVKCYRYLYSAAGVSAALPTATVETEPAGAATPGTDTGTADRKPTDKKNEVALPSPAQQGYFDEEALLNRAARKRQPDRS